MGTLSTKKCVTPVVPIIFRPTKAEPIPENRGRLVPLSTLNGNNLETIIFHDIINIIIVTRMALYVGWPSYKIITN